MTEFWLFAITALIAVIAATLMLVQSNAVYSALFLIVVMGCISFLFILLDAPFLAMIQITVYAGAIMVLFIFVIMLLGAERVTTARTRFRWLTPLAVVLAVSFLFAAGIALLNGNVALQAPPPSAPQVRVVNATTAGVPVTVYVGDAVFTSDLSEREATDFTPVPVGAMNVTVTAGATTRLFEATFEPNTVQTLVVYGEGERIALGAAPKDLTTPPNRSARFSVFNAYDVPVRLVDAGVDALLDDPADTAQPQNDRVLIADVAPGATSPPIIVPEGTRNLMLVADDDVLYRLRGYAIERETSSLIVLNPRRLADNSLTGEGGPVYSEDAVPSFGGPEAIGLELFTRYLLPFELVSMLLLAAMVGAIVLTHRETARVRDRAAARRRVSRPLAAVVSEQVGHDVAGDDAPRLPAESPAGD